MKVLFTGGRTYSDYDRVTQVLDVIQPTHIIHGAAKGADSLVGRYAAEHRIRCTPYPAQWRKKDPRTGRIYVDRSEGIKRNKRMLLQSRPDLVIAFPGGNGTAHMSDFARSNGYRVVRIPGSGPLPELPTAGGTPAGDTPAGDTPAKQDAD